MKIRVRFSKQGQMKFIGHLDMVRYFQKVMRRAEVDVIYSEGFSPHQKMSFAAPLSVGVISKGEYFDMEVNSTQSSEEMIRRINAENVEGVEVLSYKLLPEHAKNAMSIVAGADYLIHFNEQYLFECINQVTIDNFLRQDKITVLKKTKKSEKEVDIKPMIYKLERCTEGLAMKVAQGSAANLKPTLVMETIFHFLNKPVSEQYICERMDMYCMENEKLVSLDDIGGIIE